MKYIGKTAQGVEIELGNPVSVRINREEDAPADDLTAVFPLYSPVPPSFAWVRVETEDQNLIFNGIVDEQIVRYAENGAEWAVKARSLAALLLDNEALPQTYYAPSLPVIFERHMRPYGFTECRGSGAVYPGKLQVTKGMSEWQVLALFCRDFLGTVPRVTPQGAVDVSGQAAQGEAGFGGKGIPYISLEENKKRCRLLSEVLVRSGKDGSYKLRTADEKAIAAGVVRRRCLNAAGGSRTPAACGEGLIKEAQRQAYEITLICPVENMPEIGCGAVLEDRFLGTVPNLRVAAGSYILDSAGQRWEITLRRALVGCRY